MYRLALAVLTALGLHVLLMLIVMPEQRIDMPELKGSGQITVSIFRSSPLESDPAEKLVESPVEKPVEENLPETDDVPVKEVVPEQDVEPLQEEVLEQEKIEDEIRQAAVIEHALPGQVEEEIKEPDPVEQQVPEKHQEVIQEDVTDEPALSYEQQLVEHPTHDAPPSFSSKEALQDPKPIADLNRPPQYPALARKRNWEGTVLLEVDIKTDGMVESVWIKESSSHTILDREAVKAVRKWHFQPGRVNGSPVKMKVLVPVHFLLEEQ